jgi:tripartite-type tricarboxylate transporter receptor subunit TctC
MEGVTMGISRRRTLQLAAAAAFAPFGRPALADTYPSRVVRLFVGFPPGGGADLATRIVANGLSELWHQQVVVENRPGAGARIALDTVAHAPADGYAMLLAPGSPLVQPLLFSTLTFDPAADLAPVSLVGTYPNIIVVPNSSPFQRLEELIAHAKANPGTMSWGSPGIGSVPHLAGELFKHRAGIEITHVPYRGANQGLMSDFSRRSPRPDVQHHRLASRTGPFEAGPRSCRHQRKAFSGRTGIADRRRIGRARV